MVSSCLKSIEKIVNAFNVFYDIFYEIQYKGPAVKDCMLLYKEVPQTPASISVIVNGTQSLKYLCPMCANYE